MAYVSKIKDSSNNINYIKYGIYPVVGTQTQSTSSWTGNVDVPSLYNGLTIAYFLPYTASSTVDVTLNLTLSDEQTTTGAIDVYYSDDSRLNSQYDEGSTILLTYWGSGMEVGGVASTAAKWVRSGAPTWQTNKTIVNFDISNPNSPTADMTFSQILTAINNGEDVEGHVQMGVADVTLPLAYSSQYQIGFAYATLDTVSNVEVGVIYKVIVDYNDIISFSSVTNNNTTYSLSISSNTQNISSSV